MNNQQQIVLLVVEFAERMGKVLEGKLLDDWVTCMSAFEPAQVEQGFMTYFNSPDVRYGFPAGPGVITGLLTKEKKTGFTHDQMMCRAWANDMTPMEPNCDCVLCLSSQ